MARALLSRVREWAVILICSLSGLPFAWVVPMPLAQWLVGSHDEDVVHYTVRYFDYLAALVCVLFCTARTLSLIC